MAIDGGYFEVEDCNIEMDDIAALLVRLYSDYRCISGGYESEESKAYAKAVGIAIRMLQG